MHGDSVIDLWVQKFKCGEGGEEYINLHNNMKNVFKFYPLLTNQETSYILYTFICRFMDWEHKLGYSEFPFTASARHEKSITSDGTSEREREAVNYFQ
jgi:hypothetical protein